MIFKELGAIEMIDQIKGYDYLVNQPFVNPSKVAEPYEDNTETTKDLRLLDQSSFAICSSNESCLVSFEFTRKG